jgi:hypothetical protein
MMRRILFWFAFSGSLLSLLSCGKKQDDFANHVTGQVTLDEQPISEGEISFQPPGGKAPVTTIIKSGLFGLNLLPGKYDAAIQLPDGRKQTIAVEVPEQGPKELKLNLKSQ